jgi:hypothetical protein
MARHPRPLLVQRDVLVAASQIAAGLADDPGEDADLRQDVQELYEAISDVLMYDEPADRGIRLVPMSFRITNFYTDMTSEFVLDLGGEEIETDHPVRCLLARLAAELADNQSYSSDFRLDALDALNQVLAGLKSAVESQEE